MNQYLLDTNICIYYIKGMYNLDKKILSVGLEYCFISEITIAELKFGVENSSKKHKEKNRAVINNFIENIQIVPIITSLDVYATEKVRLRKAGTPMDEFDLLIGCSAIANGITLITNNIKHFQHLQDIRLENWTV